MSSHKVSYVMELANQRNERVYLTVSSGREQSVAAATPETGRVPLLAQR